MRTSLKTKLASIATVNSIATGVYMPPIPQAAQYPIVTFQAALESQHPTCSGLSELHRDVWQIDAYAAGAGAWVVVDTLMHAIRDALNNSAGQTWSGKKVLTATFDEGRDIVENERDTGGGVVRRSADFVIKWTE